MISLTFFKACSFIQVKQIQSFKDLRNKLNQKKEKGIYLFLSIVVRFFTWHLYVCMYVESFSFESPVHLLSAGQ